MVNKAHFLIDCVMKLVHNISTKLIEAARASKCGFFYVLMILFIGLKPCIWLNLPVVVRPGRTIRRGKGSAFFYVELYQTNRR